MKYEMSVTYDDIENIIKVISNGEKNFDTARNLWEQISSVAEKVNCFRILGTAYTEKNHGTLEGYDHHKLFKQLGIDYRYKIAWVEQNSDMFEDVDFIITVLMNRGTRVKLFSDPYEAKSWLLGYPVSE